LVWEHLSLSGLVSLAAFHRSAVVSWNSSLYSIGLKPDIGMFLVYAKGKNRIASGFAAYGGAYILMGGAYYNFFLPEEVYYYDRKIDDGLPFTGKVTANFLFGYDPPYGIATCTVDAGGGNYTVNRYDLTVTSLNSGLNPGQDQVGGCSPVFDTAF